MQIRWYILRSYKFRQREILGRQIPESFQGKIYVRLDCVQLELADVWFQEEEGSEFAEDG